MDIRFSADAAAVARWRQETGLKRLWPYVDDVERWLDANQSGVLFRPEPYKPPFIYTYVPVSKLGALSQQGGVTLVKALQDKDRSFAASQGASGGTNGRRSAPTSTTGGDGSSHPFQPEWMYSFDPYAQIGSKLGELVWRYDQGELTAEQVVDEYGSGEGSAVKIEIYFKADPSNTNAIAAWLRSKGVTPDKVETHEVYDDLIVADVPVSLLVDLIRQDPGMNIKSTKGVSGATGRPIGLLPSANPSPRSSNTPLESQGAKVHGAKAWQTDGYYGAAIRVGIIDNGFDGFNDLMGTELPGGYLVKRHCYEVTKNTAGEITVISTNHTDVIGACAGDSHGTTVAEAVVDVAPHVLMYISNAAADVGTDQAKTRFKETVAWMIGQNVQIINYSGSWPFEGGMGDGVPRVSNDLLEAVDDAVAAGILWVNSAGNDHERNRRRRPTHPLPVVCK